MAFVENQSKLQASHKQALVVLDSVKLTLYADSMNCYQSLKMFLGTK